MTGAVSVADNRNAEPVELSVRDQFIRELHPIHVDGAGKSFRFVPCAKLEIEELFRFYKGFRVIVHGIVVDNFCLELRHNRRVICGIFGIV